MSDGTALSLVLLALLIGGGLALVVFAERTARGIQEFRDSSRGPHTAPVRVAGVVVFLIGIAGLIAIFGL